jgi:hypothetical protein
MDNSCYIYVLHLEQGKYYVGRSKLEEGRIIEHFTGEKSCQWTRKYKPIEVCEKFRGDPLYEDFVTKIYMAKYGIDNVRGGAYSNIKLEEYQILSLQRELYNALNLCFLCGASDHYMKYCTNKVKRQRVDSQKIEKQKMEKPSKSRYLGKCYKCGDNTHYVKDCPKVNLAK